MSVLIRRDSTLEAVAAAAGVSKGGLLYHYRTKELLITSLVTRAVDQVDAALASAREVVRLAVDGWWIAGVLDLPHPTASRSALRRYVLSLLPNSTDTDSRLA